MSSYLRVSRVHFSYFGSYPERLYEVVNLHALMACHSLFSYLNPFLLSFLYLFLFLYWN